MTLPQAFLWLLVGCGFAAVGVIVIDLQGKMKRIQKARDEYAKRLLVAYKLARRLPLSEDELIVAAALDVEAQEWRE